MILRTYPQETRTVREMIDDELEAEGVAHCDSIAITMIITTTDHPIMSMSGIGVADIRLLSSAEAEQ
jgi:hypothetical protein